MMDKFEFDHLPTGEGWAESAACKFEDPELLPERFRTRIEIDSDGHWLWNGQINNKGYGLVWFEGRKIPAHVAVWRLLIGPTTPGLEFDHLCPYTHCCRPRCLEEVTHAENQRRIGERQKTCRRRGHPRTPENTYRNPKTGRTRCRACAREDDRARSPRKEAAR